MKLLKPLTALVSALTLSAAPAVAKVDAGTPALLASVQQYGVTVALNTPVCSGDFAGSYHTGTKVLTVCYNGKPTADDHDTVRHEAMHVAQNCAAAKYGQPHGIRPILRGAELDRFVRTHLSDEKIVWIKSVYPAQKHLTELEAFAGAEAYTAAQVQSIVKSWCG